MIKKQKEMKIEVREKMRGGEGSIIIKHFFDKSDFTAKVRICALLTINPQNSIGMHQHSEEDEVYIILRGSGIIDDGTTINKVSQGDAILTGRGGSHSIRNDSDEPLEIIAFISCY